MSADSVIPGDITLLIERWQDGDRAAESELFAALYDNLYLIALRCVRHEAPNQSLGPTALVHEAYLRFAGAQPLRLNNRGHMLYLAARVMRRILVDRARARRSAKRDGIRVSEEYVDLVRTDADADQILSVDRAMEALAKESPESCRLVEMRFFAGFSEEQCAELMGISSRTVRRKWQITRVRLKGLIDGAAE